MGYGRNFLDYVIVRGNLQLSNSIVTVNHGPECLTATYLFPKNKNLKQHVQDNLRGQTQKGGREWR